jgi:subtilisin family serine protease
MEEVVLAGKQLALEEISELRAVRAEAGMMGSKTTQSVLRTLRSAARSTVTKSSVMAQQRQIMEGAGWVLALHRETTVDAARNLTTGSPESAVRRVYRAADGRLRIESNRLIVRTHATWSLREAAAEFDKLGLRLVRPLAFIPNGFEVASSPNDSLRQARALVEDRQVVYAEPDFIEEVPPRAQPSDPFYQWQWQWSNDGSNGGVAGADVGAEAAWDKTLGDGVRVAVIDNGFDMKHPDLAPGVAGGGYFIDDGIGSPTFVPYVANDPGFPIGNHGTFCLGMVGARWNNGVAGVGGAPRCGLVPIACLQDQLGTQATLARAVAYAAQPQLEDASAPADGGADIISCSLGPGAGPFLMTSVLRDAIDYVVTNGRGGQGTPVFWAVSNEPQRVALDEVCSYSNTIAVGRSTRIDMEDGSAYGPELDFLAPGVSVFSTKGAGGFGSGTGTSYAAPCAAAIGALVAARNPAFTWIEIRDRLRSTCKKIGTDAYVGQAFGGRNDRYGFGRVDAAAALAA